MGGGLMSTRLSFLARRSPTPLAELAGVVVVIAAFGWICFQHLELPGLYGDEAWSAAEGVRLALGKQDLIDAGPWQRVSVAGYSLPYMLNDYVGPLKTYVLAASFRVFGVTLSRYARRPRSSASSLSSCCTC